MSLIPNSLPCSGCGKLKALEAGATGWTCELCLAPRHRPGAHGPKMRTQEAWSIVGVEDTTSMDRIAEVLQRTDLSEKQKMHEICCVVGDTDRLCEIEEEEQLPKSHQKSDIAERVARETLFSHSDLLSVLERYPAWGEHDLLAVVQYAASTAVDLFVAANLLKNIQCDDETELQLSEVIRKVYEESDGTANVCIVPKGSLLDGMIESGEFEKMEENPHEWIEDKLVPAPTLSLDETITRMDDLAARWDGRKELENLVSQRLRDTVFSARAYLRLIPKPGQQSYTEIFAPVEDLKKAAQEEGVSFRLVEPTEEERRCY